ncbi:MAG: hypothetical protein ABSH13_17060 [Candidatus Acidiferrum sp.]|jgi:hypothetical protein
MEGRIENLDWVAERAACSLALIFEKLKDQIKVDVEERNKLRPEGVAYKFVAAVQGDSITVAGESNRPYIAVKFEISGNEIIVKDKRDEITLRATLTLNDQGECKLKSNGQERELWQFRREALEYLFFNHF